MVNEKTHTVFVLCGFDLCVIYSFLFCTPLHTWLLVLSQYKGDEIRKTYNPCCVYMLGVVLFVGYLVNLLIC